MNINKVGPLCEIFLANIQCFSGFIDPLNCSSANVAEIDAGVHSVMDILDAQGSNGAARQPCV